MTDLKLGKATATPEVVKFAMYQIANTGVLPDPPPNFGHDKLVSKWGMLGNDVAGDCVFAGAGHEVMLWNAEAGTPVAISDATALHNYSAATGYDPKQTDAQGSNPTDQGTNVAQWLSRRRKVGFIDDYGRAHKIGAYVKLTPGNVDQLRYAAYYFDGVGIGVQFPEQWMETFQRGGRVWDQVLHPNYVGGHYITCVSYRDGRPVIVTWGTEVELTPAGYRQNCDEVYAYLSPEKIAKGVDSNGFSYTKLRAMLSQTKGVQ